MRRFVIGTAGHVDHGKTTLVRALTGVETDRLPEEKRRGISIELGFAPLDLGDGCVASIVDVPGHHRLVRTMIAGASGIELVIVTVAANEGVMPQTREHVAVCELLDISHALVVITKTDTADSARVHAAADETRELLGPRWRVTVATCSARTGDGIDGVREALRRAIGSLPDRPRREMARLHVDRVFTVRGAGTVVTGTLVAAAVTVGEAVFVVGESGARPTAVRSLHVHDHAVTRADAPTRLAINLAGIAREDVKRGDVVTTDPGFAPASRFDLLLSVSPRERWTPRRGASVTVHTGTCAIAARVDAIDAVPGGLAARIRLERPAAIAGGDRVLLRAGADGTESALGGGVVIDAKPNPRMAGAARRALVVALSSLAPEPSMRALVDASSPRPLLRDALARRFAVESRALESVADDAVHRGVLAPVGEGVGWVARATLEELVRSARELVVRHRQHAPLERGLPLETLRAQLAAVSGRLVAEQAIRMATAGTPVDQRLAIDGDTIRIPEDAGEETSVSMAHARRVAALLHEAGNSGSSEAAILRKGMGTPAELRAALNRLERDGAAVRLANVWFARDVIDGARARILEYLEANPSITVIQFKTMARLPRNQAVLILEHFDALGLTRREGDARVRLAPRAS
jgi:selenocysteine-specific elongation factor